MAVVASLWGNESTIMSYQRLMKNGSELSTTARGFGMGCIIQLHFYVRVEQSQK
jgi:hypothetical protein